MPGRIVLFGLVLFSLVWLAWFVWVLRRRFGKAAIIRPRAPPLDDARTLSVSAGDQLPQRRKLPQVSNSKNAKKCVEQMFRILTFVGVYSVGASNPKRNLPLSDSDRGRFPLRI